MIGGIVHLSNTGVGWPSECFTDTEVDGGILAAKSDFHSEVHVINFREDVSRSSTIG